MLLRRSWLVLIVAPLACGRTDDVITSTSISATADTSTGEATDATSGMLTSTSGVPTTGPDPTTTTSTSMGSTSDTSATTAPTTATTGSTGVSSSSGGETTAPPETCDDGVQNQDETDVDCGGSCSPCLEGQGCQFPADCVTGECDGGVCVPAGCKSDDECAPLSDGCNTGVCDPDTKMCVKVPVGLGESCDDGDACTTIDACVDGACVGNLPVDCSNLDSFCGVGVCDPQTGQCGVEGKDGMEGVACDDGFDCTPDDVCNAGVCGDGTPGYVLFEDFSGNAPGWTLGATWEIGQAKMSKNAPTGMDPKSDHTSTDDERLAGVLIGGVVEGAAQPLTCLTSPAVDVTVGKNAWVTLWRHLHTDYFPFAFNQIEVFDGIDWIEVEAGYNNPGVDDPNWKQIFFDVTEFANDAFQFRICYLRQANAQPFAGWSIDDVTIGPYVCTP